MHVVLNCIVGLGPFTGSFVCPVFCVHCGVCDVERRHERQAACDRIEGGSGQQARARRLAIGTVVLKSRVGVESSRLIDPKDSQVQAVWLLCSYTIERNHFKCYHRRCSVDTSQESQKSGPGVTPRTPRLRTLALPRRLGVAPAQSAVTVA